MLKVLAALGLAALAAATPLWQPHLFHASVGRNIRHLPCVSKRTGEAGTCMFAFSCAKANGTHLGTCIDRFYFGSCCKMPSEEDATEIDAVPPIEDNSLDGTSTVGIRPAVTQKPLSSSSSSAATPPSTVATAVTKPTTASPTLVTWTTVEEASGKPLLPASLRPQVSASSAGTHRPVLASSSTTKTPTVASTETLVGSTSRPGVFTTQRPPPSTARPPLVTQRPEPSTQTASSTNWSSIAPVSSQRPPVSTHRPVTVATPTPSTHWPNYQPVSIQTSLPPSSTPSTLSTARPPPTTVRPPPSTLRPPLSTTRPPSTSRPTSITRPPSTKGPSSTSRPANATRPSSTSHPGSTTRPSSTSRPASTTRPPGTSRPTGTTRPPSTSRPTGTTRPPSTSPRPVSNVHPPPSQGQPSLTTNPSSSTAVHPTQVTQKPVTPRPPVTSPKPKPPQRPVSKPGNKPKPTVKPKPPVKPTPTTNPTTRPTTTSIKTTVSTPMSSSTQKPTTETWVPISVTTHAPATILPTDKTSTSAPISTTQILTTQKTVTSSVNSSLSPETSTTPTQATTIGPSFTQNLNMSNYKDVCGRRLFPESRVVGGDKSTFGKWPWQISLRQWRTSTYLHKCGAALLNENWAITAAHCVENVPPSDLLLRLGEHDLSVEDEPYGYQERRVQIVASHPQFDPRTFEYDLALLRFYEPVTFQPNIIPICVPEDDVNFVGSTAYVTGWGRLYEDGPLPSVLQEVSVPVINNSLCETMYRAAGYIEHIPDIFICAGWKKGGFDSCEGDSGGPMVIQRPDRRWLLAGVISWGIGCAEPNQPGVYTRISQFRDWINQILQF